MSTDLLAGAIFHGGFVLSNQLPGGMVALGESESAVVLDQEVHDLFPALFGERVFGAFHAGDGFFRQPSFVELHAQMQSASNGFREGLRRLGFHAVGGRRAEWRITAKQAACRFGFRPGVRDGGVVGMAADVGAADGFVGKPVAGSEKRKGKRFRVGHADTET
ncbi:MAG: hypothetical protein ACRDD1_01350 [Planctomycetia bacterium]